MTENMNNGCSQRDSAEHGGLRKKQIPLRGR